MEQILPTDLDSCLDHLICSMEEQKYLGELEFMPLMGVTLMRLKALVPRGWITLVFMRLMDFEPHQITFEVDSTKLVIVKMPLASEHLLLDFAITFETQVHLRTLEFACFAMQDLQPFFFDSCYFSNQHLSRRVIKPLIIFLAVNCYSELTNSHQRGCSAVILFTLLASPCVAPASIASSPGFCKLASRLHLVLVFLLALEGCCRSLLLRFIGPQSKIIGMLSRTP